VATAGSATVEAGMAGLVLEFGVLDPAEWAVLRRIRLRALRDSPHAFAARYAEEVTWSEEVWRTRLTGNAWLIARAACEIIGIACLTDLSRRRRKRYVESVWVEPAYRRRGVLRSLIDTAVPIALCHDTSALLVWVMEHNGGALRAYQRLGFAATGRRQPIGADHHELQLCRPLTE
jgi:GNAT superfamily N-acetyltransferase